MALNHAVQDGIDAAARARTSFTPHWHPILAAVEDEPGSWRMIAQYGQCYGVIRMLEIAGERGYRAVTWAERSEDRELIGYYRSLRAACAATHERFVRSRGAGARPFVAPSALRGSGT